MLKFTIPLAPITKKNSSRILKAGNKRFVAPSAQFKDFESKALWFCPKYSKIETPVICKYIFYMPTHRKVDGLNLESAIDDVLVKAGTLADDNRDIVVGHDGSRVYYDKENPRIEVEISKVNEPYEQWSNKKK